MGVCVYRKCDSWSNGEGVALLGHFPSHYNDIRLSYGGDYIAGATSSSINVFSLSNDKVHPLGEYIGGTISPVNSILVQLLVY